MPFSLVLLNQIEQVLFYIAGFGLSDLYVKRSKMSDKQQIIYYVLILIVAFGIILYTKDN
jgi:hypothetical protein